MLTGIVSQLADDIASIRDVVARLTPAQRQGFKPLPSPLPFVPRLAEAFETLEPSSADRDLLLAVALCLDHDVEPIVSFSGRTVDEIAESEVGELLTVRAGTIAFDDQRLAIWIRETSPSARHASVHSRLSTVFAARGDRVSADWHRARASRLGIPETAAELTRIARQLSEAGEPDRALLLAAEATEHAVGADLDEARLVAGASAIGAGYSAEAAAWLSRLFPDGTEKFRLQGLTGLIIAQSFLQGAVPDLDPAAFRPGSQDLDDWYSWTRAAAIAAVLCAERGDRRGMRAWLDALREGCAKVGSERELRDPVVALSWLVAGEPDVDRVDGSGPLTGGMLRALQCALDGDIDGGLRLLAAEDAGTGFDVDPFVAGFEHSPIVHAYRLVVEVLLLVWRGDIALARSRLIAGSLELPVAMPFAGLGVVLARRLDLAVLGELGPFARALTAALPPTVRIDQLVDDGIRSFLGGDFENAVSAVRLWVDLGSPQPRFAVPGLEEVLSGADVPDGGPTRIRPPSVDVADRLGMRLATVTDARWRAERDDVHAAARALESPFARARIESMLGVQSAVRDDRVAARSFLLTAQRLFDVSGAYAWARSTAARLSRLDAQDGAGSVPIDPLAVCRSAWSNLLTARELEVAMLAVGGAMNRDIAEGISVSVRTVEVHLGRVFAKLGVRTRVELTVLAHRTNQMM